MIRDFSIVMRGTLIAQAIGLLTLPILSRLFSPEAFGHFAVYQAAIMVLIVIACLRYDMAILTAGDEAEAIGLFKLSLAIAAGLSALAIPALLVLELASASPSAWFGFSVLWLAPATFLSGTLIAASALLTRLAQFRLSVGTKIGQAAVTSGASLGFGFAMPIPSPTGLVAADLMGRTAALGVFAVKLPRALPSRLPDRAARDRYRALARKYISFPRFSVLGGLLNNGGSFIAPAAILSIYGAAIAGQFSLADRAISLPLGMVIVAVSQVFSSHFGAALRESAAAARSYFRKVLLSSTGLALVPAAVGVAIAPWLFTFAFGPDWTLAGHYAQVMAVMYYSALVFGPVSSGLIVLGRLREQFLWEAVRLALIAAVWVAAAMLPLAPATALGLWAAAITIVNFWYVWMVDAALRRLAAADRPEGS